MHVFLYSKLVEFTLWSSGPMTGLEILKVPLFIRPIQSLLEQNLVAPSLSRLLLPENALVLRFPQKPVIGPRSHGLAAIPFRRARVVLLAAEIHRFAVPNGEAAGGERAGLPFPVLHAKEDLVALLHEPLVRFIVKSLVESVQLLRAFAQLFQRLSHLMSDSNCSCKLGVSALFSALSQQNN